MLSMDYITLAYQIFELFMFWYYLSYESVSHGRDFSMAGINDFSLLFYYSFNNITSYALFYWRYLLITYLSFDWTLTYPSNISFYARFSFSLYTWWWAKLETLYKLKVSVHCRIFLNYLLFIHPNDVQHVQQHCFNTWGWVKLETLYKFKVSVHCRIF